jgi:hypothetical protein
MHCTSVGHNSLQGILRIKKGSDLHSVGSPFTEHSRTQWPMILVGPRL